MGAVPLSEQDRALTWSPAQSRGLELCPTCCVGHCPHLGLPVWTRCGQNRVHGVISRSRRNTWA